MKRDHIGLFDSDDPDDNESAPSDPASIFSSINDEPRENDKVPFALSQSEPQSMAETVRQSGLAYSAGIVLFASVAFMLIIGWGADLIFGSSPWGIVLGIVIGALIGFVQFFRITSQIFKK